MPDGRVRRGRRSWAPLAALALVAPGLIAPSAGVPLPAPDAPAARAPATVPTYAPQLEIDPASWWTDTGNVTPVTAVWTAAPPGCRLVPLWYRWSPGSTGFEGELAPLAGPTTNFTALGGTSGPSSLDVVGASQVVCGRDSTTVVARASATYAVDAALSIRAVHAVLPPAGSGLSAEALGTIVGGRAPYLVSVDWGDGPTTSVTVSSAGNFSVSGGSVGPGFDPRVTVSDAAGVVARARSEENGTVGGPLQIALVPSSWGAEVGVPLRIAIVSSVAADAFSTAAVCEEVGGRSDAALDADDFACDFATPGTANISVTAEETGFPYASAYAQLIEPVAPLPTVAIGNATVPGETGRTSYVPVTVAGGVPPLRLRAGFEGNDSTAARRVATDGTYLLAMNASRPGTEEAVVSVVDALGVAATNASAPIEIAPALAAAARVGATPASGGTAIAVAGSIVAGVPPFDWAMVPDTPVVGNSTSAGTAVGPGPFAASSTAHAEGPINVSVDLVDAAGAEWSSTESVMGVPALLLTAVGRTGPAGGWSVEVGVVGGAPPFELWANGTDGTSVQRSIGADGDSTVSAPSAAGPLTIEVTVVDRLGVAATANVSVVATPLAAVSPLLGEVGAIATIVGVAAVVVGWRRRRGRRPPVDPAPPDPVPVIRGIVEPADGVDRGTVELLAEEEGVPIEAARAAVDRLIADGRLQAERGDDGEEILAWRDPP